MPNPFLTNAPNKKGRHHRRQGQPQQQPQQGRQQQNPFLNNFSNSNSNSNSFSQGAQPRGNSFSEQQKCIHPAPSFEESFPSLSQSQSQSQIPVPPKLNFKSAIQGNQGQINQGQINQGNQGNQGQGQGQGQPIQGHSQPIQGHPTRLSNPIQLQNQFLRPQVLNQFLHHIHYHRDHNENECNDEDLNNDAYDSAYTKYYDD
jgi:hypothetical protein